MIRNRHRDDNLLVPQPTDKFLAYGNTKKTIRMLVLDQFPISFETKKNVKIEELQEKTETEYEREVD